MTLIRSVTCALCRLATIKLIYFLTSFPITPIKNQRCGAVLCCTVLYGEIYVLSGDRPLYSVQGVE